MKRKARLSSGKVNAALDRGRHLWVKDNYLHSEKFNFERWLCRSKRKTSGSKLTIYRGSSLCRRASDGESRVSCVLSSIRIALKHSFPFKISETAIRRRKADSV